MTLKAAMVDWWYAERAWVGPLARPRIYYESTLADRFPEGVVPPSCNQRGEFDLPPSPLNEEGRNALKYAKEAGISSRVRGRFMSAPYFQCVGKACKDEMRPGSLICNSCIHDNAYPSSLDEARAKLMPAVGGGGGGSDPAPAAEPGGDSALRLIPALDSWAAC